MLEVREMFLTFKNDLPFVSPEIKSQKTVIHRVFSKTKIYIKFS